jgi:hypothetical protein
MGILFRFIAPINNTIIELGREERGDRGHIIASRVAKCFTAHCECDVTTHCERDVRLDNNNNNNNNNKEVGSIKKI